MKDTDERARAYIAGPAPNRWGFNVEGHDLFELIDNSLHTNGNFGNRVKNMLLNVLLAFMFSYVPCWKVVLKLLMVPWFPLFKCKANSTLENSR